MADVAQPNASEAHTGETRRDFLLLTAGAIGGGMLGCATDDLPHDGVHLVSMCLEEWSDRRHALRHPRPFVEQRCRIQEQGKIQLRGLSTHLAELLHSVVESAPREDGCCPGSDVELRARSAAQASRSSIA
jgi:hypothetical protein